MTVIKIGKRGADGTVSNIRELNFSNGAQFNTEIIPSILKIQEFACGSILWIDSGMFCKRAHLKDKTCRMMSPIRRRNTGFTSNVSDLLESYLMEYPLNVVNANGEGFVITYELKADPKTHQTARPGDEHELRYDSGIISPIAVAVDNGNPSDRFASVQGYVPKSARTSL